MTAPFSRVVTAVVCPGLGRRSVPSPDRATLTIATTFARFPTGKFRGELAGAVDINRISAHTNIELLCVLHLEEPSTAC